MRVCSGLMKGNGTWWGSGWPIAVARGVGWVGPMDPKGWWSWRWFGFMAFR